MAEPSRCIAMLILLHGHVNGHENRSEHDRTWLRHIFQTVHNHTVSTDRQLTNRSIFKAFIKTSLKSVQSEQNSLPLYCRSVYIYPLGFVLMLKFLYLI